MPEYQRTAARKVRAAVLVDAELCKACGICISLCPEHVFDRDPAGLAVAARQEDCTACMTCEWHCPDFAIEVRVERAKVASDAVPADPDAVAADADAEGECA
jgi:NAD-dependent dihydropyrimidine dehydrogenase PreA subunit